MSELARFEVSEALDRIAARFPANLVDPVGRRAVASFARGLPPIFSWLVLECQLAPEKRDKVDLLACIVDSPMGRGPIVEHLGRARRHPALAQAGVLETWACQFDARLDDVHVVWMEWDAPFSRSAPLQLVAIDPRFWGPNDGVASVDRQVALAAAGHEASFGLPHDARTLAHIGRLIRALPAGGTAIFHANLRPRGLPTIDRLFVELPPGTASAWLTLIGWPGDARWAASWLARIYASWEPAFLQIELGPDGVHPYLGLEPRQTSGTLSERRERKRLLDVLVEDGRASRDAVDALLAWEGRERVSPTCELVRSYHLKHIRSSSGEEVTKAYLGVCYAQS